MNAVSRGAARRREPAAGACAPADPREQARRLGAVPSTLRIPLAARALGDALFPEVAVHDRSAAAALAAIGDDGQAWLEDRATVYGVLARTHLFRELATAFFGRHPHAVGVNLGCGLADYAQWIGEGAGRWLDADLPEVIALREDLVPARGALQATEHLDLARRGWWPGLGLPDDRPVYAMCEGVLMYLTPSQVQQVFDEIAAHAAEGSEFVFDVMCWLAVGRAALSPSVRRTAAQFRWGPRRIAELDEIHPRLRLASEHPVMEGYGFPYAYGAPLFRWLTGMPVYAVVRLVVGAAPAGYNPPPARP